MILLSLRQAIFFKRVEGRSNEELVQIIQDSIDAEEKVLPGLGVLFEMIWKNSDTALREKKWWKCWVLTCRPARRTRKTKTTEKPDGVL